MKKNILICRVFLIVCFASSLTLVSCRSKKPVVNKIATTENITLLKLTNTEIVKKKRAYDLGRRLLETCNVSKFRGFSDTEATDKVRKNATKEKISSVCKKINLRNGLRGLIVLFLNAVWMVKYLNLLVLRAIKTKCKTNLGFLLMRD